MPPPKAAIPKPKLAPRLPPLPRLKVRRVLSDQNNPCMGIMTAVLGCWASSGQANRGCIELEEALRKCMDEPKPQKSQQGYLNYNLGRFKERFEGRTKPAKPTRKGR